MRLRRRTFCKNRAMATIPLLPLNSGHWIPQLGIGTYRMDNVTARRAVREALAMGYRHIDTAQMYGNEAAVGTAIAESGVDREDIFLVTKLDNPHHAPRAVRETFARSLADLGTDYVDLFLIHWPMLSGDYVEAYQVMEEFVADGRARAIGVSNFERHHLEALRFAAHIQPAVNQIEAHPYFQNAEVTQYCTAAGIRVEAWAPLARGAVNDDAVLAELAAAKGCTVAQLVLLWHLSRGRIVFPGASSTAHLAENLACLEYMLLKEEAEEIDNMDRFEAGRTGRHPDTFRRNGE